MYTYGVSASTGCTQMVCQYQLGVTDGVLVTAISNRMYSYGAYDKTVCMCSTKYDHIYALFVPAGEGLPDLTAHISSARNGPVFPEDASPPFTVGDIPDLFRSVLRADMHRRNGGHPNKAALTQNGDGDGEVSRTQ